MRPIMKSKAAVAPTQGMPLMLTPVSPPPTAPPRGSPRLYKALSVLGAVQIVLVIICLIWLSVLWAKHSVMNWIGFTVAASVGLVMLISGSFGIAAGKHRKKCLIITFMVLCIISAALACGVLICYSMGLAADVGDYRYRLTDYIWNNYDDYYWYDGCNDYINEDGSGEFPVEPCRVAVDRGPMIKEVADSQYRLVLAMYGLVLISCVVQLVVAVVASAFSCRALCCGQQLVGLYPGMQIAYMVQIPPASGGYHQPQLFVPSAGQTGAEQQQQQQPTRMRPAILTPPDMYPIDIPVEQWDVTPSPTQSRPPSYTSLRGEEEEKTVGKVQAM